MKQKIMIAVMSTMLAGCGIGGQKGEFKLQANEQPLVTEDVARRVEVVAAGGADADGDGDAQQGGPVLHGVSPGSGGGLVLHEVGGIAQRGHQLVTQGGIHRQAFKGFFHAIHPLVAGRLIDGKRQMAGAQARVAMLFHIQIGAAQPAGQKHEQLLP